MEQKIVVIEDEPLTQVFYKKLLSDKLGYKIDILEDGDKIIAAVQEENYKLIILDINLKNTYLNGQKTDGVELSKRIKTDFSDRNIPVLLITAYRKGSKGNNFFIESLADDYIIKPISDFNILLEKVSQLIKND